MENGSGPAFALVVNPRTAGFLNTLRFPDASTVAIPEGLWMVPESVTMIDCET